MSMIGKAVTYWADLTMPMPGVIRGQDPAGDIVRVLTFTGDDFDTLAVEAQEPTQGAWTEPGPAAT